MIYVFIKDSIKNTGLARYTLGITVAKDVQVIYTDDLRTQAGIDYSDGIGIFAGYIPEEINFFLSRFKKTYYVYSSPLGQADMSSPHFYSVEIQLLVKLLHMREQKRLTNLIVTSQPLAERFNFICFPPVYICNENSVIYTENRYGYSFVGNNLRKHKNVVNTIAAISLLPPETIYVSDAEMYGGYSKMFDCHFSTCREQDDNKFQIMLSTHKLAFQCSYSESFNYLALEYAFHGIPCIVSPCIDWYPIPDCIVQNIDNPSKIWSVANDLLMEEKKYWSISKELKTCAPLINQMNIDLMKMKAKEL